MSPPSEEFDQLWSDMETAEETKQAVYEVLIAPSYDAATFGVPAKKKRILLQYNHQTTTDEFSYPNGSYAQQDTDLQTETVDDSHLMSPQSPIRRRDQ
jgi:AICAR transformylase/IMP cyclohydrolase PurH